MQGNKKRGPIPLKGKEAVVMKVLGRGTVFLEAPGSGDPPTRLQQKCAADAIVCGSMPLMLASKHAPRNQADEGAGSLRFTTLLRPARDAPPALVPPAPSPAVAQPSARQLPAPKGAERPGRCRVLCAVLLPPRPHMRDPAVACAVASEPSSVALPPGEEVSGGAPQTEREMLQVVRCQMMDDEAEVPWDAVHSFWRSRRSRWRQVICCRLHWLW